MAMGDFKVKSLEAIGTINQNLDVGVIRVAGAAASGTGPSSPSLARARHFESVDRATP